MARTKDGAHSPAMRQFFDAKAQYPDALLFFRMGDFYELFYDDARVAAEALDLTLTSRSKTKEGDEIPMAGVPHHAAAGYLARLLDKGFKVAICEQMADPSTVKGVVPREVVRVATPGLTLETDSLDARTDNVLAVLVVEGEGLALAALELTRAELRVCALGDLAQALAELCRLDPREVLVAGADTEMIKTLLGAARVAPVQPPKDPRALLEHVLGHDASARACAALSPLALRAAATALDYARAAQPRAQLGVREVVAYDPRRQLVLDEVAIRNLELVRTLGGERRGSLLAHLDQTKSAVGARLLRRRLLAPLADRAPIRRRLDAVEAFVGEPERRAAVQRAMAELGDLERLATRAEIGLATPRDLGDLRGGLYAAQRVVDALCADKPIEVFKGLCPGDLCDDVASLLATALAESLPVVAGVGVVRDGIDARVDELRALSQDAKGVLLALEKRERESSGIASLKVRYTRVFGYYIEVTRSNLHLVPKHYRRKQTIANGERYITEELEETQAKILGADERVRGLEIEIFEDVRVRVGRDAGRIRALAHAMAEVDVHAALAHVAHEHDYVRPEVDESTVLELSDSRHPIVEVLAARGSFVPNDVSLDADGARLLVITGPNMAGKSTTMRQVALAAIMAQAGSFVAASRARIGMVDRVFTRVGASDNLSRGQSTFMVEMQETATILAEATPRSLVVLDEIGRGTSTYDGLAIAWAVAEHLHDTLRCRALFATHYHELCELAATRAGVRNVNVAAREQDGAIVFLHALVEGASNRSYGVAVARLAGVDERVLERARQMLEGLETGAPLPSGAVASVRGRIRAELPQLDLFGGAPGAAPLPASEPSAATPSQERPAAQDARVLKALKALDPDGMTPIEALVELAKLASMARSKGGRS